MSNIDTKNQQGMVSIMVTLIMMLVISLIVLSFAQVTRTNQREALNRQLSTQAFYAAETGVNDAVKPLLAHTAVLSPADNSNCNQFITDNNLTAKQTLDSTTAVSYTCLLVNANPSVLEQKPLKQQANTVWPLIDAAGNAISQLQFTWASNSGGSGTPSTCTDGADVFSPDGASRTCSFGILRIDLLQYNDSNPLDPAIAGPDQAASLANHTVTIFAQPTQRSTSAITISDFTASSGRAIVAQCPIVTAGATSTCTVNVDLRGVASSSSYYARLTMLYEDSASVSVTGTDNLRGPVDFKNGQAVIDATGKAQDELRRIQVRVPLSGVGNSTTVPTNALQSTGSVCKLLTVSSAGYDDASTTDPNCI